MPMPNFMGKVSHTLSNGIFDILTFNKNFYMFIGVLNAFLGTQKVSRNS